MKTFNTKLIVSLFITLIMTGCMPDSMTKFKKDEPKKAASSETTVPVVDEEGNAIDTSLLVNPTFFGYKFDGNTALTTEVNVAIGSNLFLLPVINGSVGTEKEVSRLFLNCEISPALPAGLRLDKTPTVSGCGISGAPLNISTDPLSPGSPINYTVTLTYIKKGGTVGTITTSIAIGVYSTIQNFSYKQNDKTLFTVNLNSGNLNTVTTSTDPDATYVRTGFIASESGAIGVVKFIDATNNKIGAIKLVPLTVTNFASLGLPAGVEYVGLSTPKFISASGGKSAKVIRAVAATNTIYVEMLSDAYFQVGDALDNEKTFVANSGSVVSVTDIDYSYVRIANQINLDNNIQYYSNRFTVATLTRSYEVNKTFGVHHPKLIIEGAPSFLTLQNGVKFTVSPQLPDGLSLDEATGEISGAFTDAIDPAAFQITAKNKISTMTTPLSLSAIKKPKDLSFSTRQLIAIKDSSKFVEGENLLKPITPPLARGIESRILRKYSRAGTDENRYKLSIDSTTGALTAGSSLDSGNFFYSEKSFIPALAAPPIQGATPSEIAANELKPVLLNYNVAIDVTDVTGFQIGGHVSTPQGATGRVVGIDYRTLFIQTTTLTNPPVHIPFQEALSVGVQNNIGNSEIYASRTVTTQITQIEANNVELALAMTGGSPPDFGPGSEITSNGKVAGYVYAADASNNISVSDILMSNVGPSSGATSVVNAFKTAQVVTDDDNIAVAPASYGTIRNVKSKENVYILEVGKYSEIQANLGEGNGVSFVASATLPMGMKLDQKTGLISGTPTVRTTLKPYEITVSNLVGTAHYLLQIEVRDYFKISDSSGMSTATLHRYGSNKNTRDCKVNATDILNAEGELDVRCFMDVEEKELHTTRLKFTTSTGAGICEFVQVEPYYFYKSSTQPTIPSGAVAPLTNTVVEVAPACSGWETNPSGPADPLTARSTIPTPDEICKADYTKRGGLNCDEGAYTLVVYSGADASTPGNGNCSDAGEVTSVTTVVQCGGKKSNCIEGAVTDVLTRNELITGYRGHVVASHEGLKYPTQLVAPLAKGNMTTLSVANSTFRNSCQLTNADADKWESYTADRSSKTSPWGESSPFYTFTCLDGASDIKARIRLVVRDWNKSFKINNSIDSDFPGVAPQGEDLMNNLEREFGKSNNDYKDWDNIYNRPASGPDLLTGGADGDETPIGVVGYPTCPVDEDDIPANPLHDYQFPDSFL